ncbi:hypothetical protein ABZ924_28590 [Streptomyces sp. NPDC046876]|uniref:hypothetical protein n=1 Tax=Streptomyces sp. NPDC046876 TaxID=3155616 RepID=UPI0033F62F60
MKPISRTVRVSVSGGRGAGAGHPYHPAAYEVLAPGDIADVLAAWPGAAAGPGGSFECMCLDHFGRVTLYEASGQVVRSLSPARAEPLARLLDSHVPDGIPARHRDRWVRAAPAGLREYAEALARGAAPDGPRPPVPLAAVFGWLGARREEPDDAASVLAEAAPLRLLADAPTADLAWAVRQTDRAGLEGAVRFFAGEHFTARHPKRRRVPDTARNLLLAHARSHRPGDLAVLERRLLRGAEDRVRRS